MCNSACIDFVTGVLEGPEVKGRRVLEIGSLDVNGSVRPVISKLDPSEYIGVDIAEGPGVDRICRAEDLLGCFSHGTFGLVVSTEVLEHVREWRRVISNMKALLEEGGILLVTTRSYGSDYHGYPYDFWRFEEQDMRELFADMHISRLQSDPLSPGVFLKAVKKKPFIEKNLAEYKLYSITKNKKVQTLTDMDVFCFRLKRRISLTARATARMLPDAIKKRLKKILRL